MQRPACQLEHRAPRLCRGQHQREEQKGRPIVTMARTCQPGASTTGQPATGRPSANFICCHCSHRVAAAATIRSQTAVARSTLGLVAGRANHLNEKYLEEERAESSRTTSMESSRICRFFGCVAKPGTTSGSDAVCPRSACPCPVSSFGICVLLQVGAVRDARAAPVLARCHRLGPVSCCRWARSEMRGSGAGGRRRECELLWAAGIK